jgi:two-component system sensor histidine kinase MprB
MTSLRFRIAMAMVAVAVLATAIVGLITGQVARQRLYAEVDRSLEQAAVVVIRGRLADPLRPLARPPRVEAIVLPERTGLESVVVQVVRVDGVIVRSNSDVVLPVDDLDQIIMVTGQGQRFRTVVIEGERYRLRTVALVGGAVQAGRSLTETDRVLSELRRRTAWWTALIAAMAASGGWLLARGITARLARLSDAADELARTGSTAPPSTMVHPEVGAPGARDEVGRLSHSFTLMVQALARARAEQERLVQDAGHELRTPLTSLRTNVEVLARYRDLDDDTRNELLLDVRRDVEDLATLVDEVLEVAAGGRADELPGPVVLRRLADEVIARFTKRQARQVTLHADDSVVLARRGGLERAVANLVDNAHKFDATGEALEVRITDGRLEVADRGPGIAPQDRATVFERFARSVTARSLPGSGLGLAIVRDVVARDHGTVFVDDRPGGGAIVGFELPVVGRAAAPPFLTGSSPSSEPAHTWSGDDDVVGGVARDDEEMN